jgi:hypothetical protein
MVMEAKGDLRAAVDSYRRSASLAPPYDWQGSYRLWRALGALGDAEAAEREEAALRRRWGDEQFRWCAAPHTWAWWAGGRGIRDRRS